MPLTRHAVLDVVELVADSGRWPLVESSDDRGHALDFISVPHDALAAAGARA